MHTFWSERYEVPKIVVRGLSLWESAVRFFFGGMDQIGKLDRILDEKHRDVVSNNIPVAFLGI